MTDMTSFYNLYLYLDRSSLYLALLLLFNFFNAGQSVSIPRHSQTRTKHVDLVTLET